MKGWVPIVVGFLSLMLTGFFLAIGFWGGRKVTDKLEDIVARRKSSSLKDLEARIDKTLEGKV